ncbi:hypothetical protein [Streptomyces sp. NPDC088719]|uniref:hypothetical protein n=1 Tax=Streptomyces sp. NPDC088719 TaxID=3365872 RepID=UPI0037F5DDEA
MVDGTGGIDEEMRSSLAAVPCAVQNARWLTPDQQIRLVAVASLVTGAARLLAEDPRPAADGLAALAGGLVAFEGLARMYSRSMPSVAARTVNTIPKGSCEPFSSQVTG